MAQASSPAPVVRPAGKRSGLRGTQPLSIHPNAFPAALASETALEQESSGKWTTGCSPTRPLSAEAHERWARELGMDLDRFRRALRKRKLARRSPMIPLWTPGSEREERPPSSSMATRPGSRALRAAEDHRRPSARSFPSPLNYGQHGWLEALSSGIPSLSGRNKQASSTFAAAECPTGAKDANLAEG